jgi:Domain of unknown function (DUF4270)
MKNIRIFLFLSIAVSLLTLACNKASLLGSDLFESDKLNLKFTDSLAISAINDIQDVVPMYENGGIQSVTLPVGRMVDNFFGTTESQIYANFSNSTNFSSIVKDSTIDSVRLVLPYYAPFVYGDTTVEQELAVYRLTERLTGDNIKSDKTFAHEATPLGRVRFFPRPNTKTIDYKRRDTSATTFRYDTVDAFVAITLPISLGKQILSLDSATLSHDSTGISKLDTWLKGFVIKSEKNTNCMLNFNISGLSTLARPAGIYIHYWAKGDTVQRQLQITPYGTKRYANYKNNYATAPVRSFINNPVRGDSLLTVQGMVGPYTRLEFTDLKKLGKIVVNKAELEVFVSQDSSQKYFTPIDQLLLLKGNTQFVAENRYVSIEDPISDALVNRTLSTYFSSYSQLSDFGGYPYTAAEDLNVKRYKMAMSAHFQRMVDGKESPQIILYPYFKTFIPSRSILYGPKHPKYRVRLNLTYTKLD